MSGLAEAAREMNALMESQISSQEFDDAVAKNKLLHDCKQKGFSKLLSLGHQSGGISKMKRKRVVLLSDIEFATMGAAEVNAGKTSIGGFAKAHGRNPSDLRYYCEKFGIDLVRKKKRDTLDHDKLYAKARQLINVDGLKLATAVKKCGCSVTLMRKIFTARKRVYNKRTNKLEVMK